MLTSSCTIHASCKPTGENWSLTDCAVMCDDRARNAEIIPFILSVDQWAFISNLIKRKSNLSLTFFRNWIRFFFMPTAIATINLLDTLQVGFPHCRVPASSFPSLSTHQQKPVALWHWIGSYEPLDWQLAMNTSMRVLLRMLKALLFSSWHCVMVPKGILRQWLLTLIKKHRIYNVSISGIISTAFLWFKYLASCN